MTDESVFAAALAIGSPADRAAFLDRACAGNPVLRKDVEELLAAHAADNPLDRPPADLARTGAYEPTDAGPPPAAVGDRIGPYRLMEQIGEGGFGLVFVAEQSEPVRRKVALKVLKPGMDTKDVVARFEAERQALALMDHPNIAKVLDAGSTPAGRPYFVMELVRGVPVTDFADQQKLAPRDRLALFAQVCNAVQHAHQKGVIHRDLKPSNVLVTSHDGVPVPKVIDFGVAKAVGQSLTEKTIYTRFAQMIGTPLYMSPEQAEMSGLDVDTRSDVYALGVLLYELLTGTTPFDRDRFRKAAFDEIRRIIREEDPPRPSTRLTSLGATLSAVSANRGTDPGRLAGVVRGELDWIVMRCLEKDRNRRYDSASGLAKDVQRYLAGDAVEACPPTLGYRLKKAYRRNRAAVWVAAGFLLLTYVGASGVYFAYQRAVRAEDDAARERDSAVRSAELADEHARQAQANEERAQREAANVRAEQAHVRRLLYASRMSAASAALAENRIPQVLQHLEEAAPQPGEPDLRGWEWHCLDWLTRTGREHKLFDVPEDGVQAMVAARVSRFESPDGRWIVRGRKVGERVVVDVHDTTDGRRIAQLPTAGSLPVPPEGSNLGLLPILSPDGRYLLVTETTSGLRAGVRATHPPRIWEVETGRELDTSTVPPLLIPRGARESVVIGPDAGWVCWLEWQDKPVGNPSQSPVTGPVEVKVRRWERATGDLPPKQFRIGSGTGQITLSPDARAVFWLPVMPFAAANTKDVALAVECWDITAAPQPRWPAIPASGPRVPIGPGGRNRFNAVLSSGRAMVAVLGRDELTVYRTPDREVHWTVPLPTELPAGGQPFLVSDDGNRVVFCGAHTLTVQEKSRPSRVAARQFHFRPIGASASRPGSVMTHSFRLLPDGKTVVGSRVLGNVARVWDVSRDPGAVDPAVARSPREWVAEADGTLWLNQTAPDGTLWRERATADGRVKVRNQSLQDAEHSRPPVIVTVTDSTGRERRYELPGGLQSRLRSPRVHFLDRDRRLLVSTCSKVSEEPDLRVWRSDPQQNWEWALYDLEVPGHLPRIAGGVGQPEPVPNSPYLLNLAPTNPAATTTEFEIRDARTGNLVRKYAAPPPSRVYVGTETFSPAGDRFAQISTTAAPNVDGPLPATVGVYATASGEHLWSVDMGEVVSIGTTHARFTPDGRRVVIEYESAKGHFLRVAAAGTGSNPQTMELAPPPKVGPGGKGGFRGRPSSILGFAADGRQVAVVVGNRADVWDMDTGRRLHRFAGHETPPRRALFTPDGTRLISMVNGYVGRSPSRIHIWDLTTGRELLTLPFSTGAMRFDDGRLFLTLPDRALDGRPAQP